MNKSSVFSAQKSTYFQILYCVLVRYTRTPDQTQHGNTDWSGSKVQPEFRNLDRIDGEPIEFEWNIFQGFTTLQLNHKVQELLLRLGETPENFTGCIVFMSMFNDISWGSKGQQERMRIKCSTRFSICKKIRSRTMLISRSWIREKVVFYQ